MADGPKGLLARLADAGARAFSAAVTEVMSDPRGQDALARAVGAAQRAKRRAEALQAGLMKAAGVPGRGEVQELLKQLARIKRKARDLAAHVEGERAGGDAPSEERGALAEPDGGRSR
jgi:hypothetical protein